MLKNNSETQIGYSLHFERNRSVLTSDLLRKKLSVFAFLFQAFLLVLRKCLIIVS